jgi:hypothetical protein
MIDVGLAFKALGDPPRIRIPAFLRRADADRRNHSAAPVAAARR